MRTWITEIDVELLRLLRRRAGATRAVPAARVLSLAGEHALAWAGLAAVGAVVQPAERRAWLGAGASVLGAHATSVALKRVVRRPRPQVDDCPPLVVAPSRLSFPSSHVTSTTAAAIVLTPLLTGGTVGGVVAGGVVGAMAASRVLLGVHYPTDVAAGCALGVATGLAGRRLLRARPSRS